MYDKSVKTRMAGMSPQQLKEFATLHKDDPFIVSMALNIDNDRKALQREQAMRAAGQPQPAVVDQTLAAIGEPEMPQQDMPPQAMPPQAAPQMQAGLPQLLDRRQRRWGLILTLSMVFLRSSLTTIPKLNLKQALKVSGS